MTYNSNDQPPDADSVWRELAGAERELSAAEVAAEALSRALAEAQAENARLTAERDAARRLSAQATEIAVMFGNHLGIANTAHEINLSELKSLFTELQETRKARDSLASTAAETGLRAGAYRGLLGRVLEHGLSHDYGCPGDYLDGPCECGEDEIRAEISAALARGEAGA